MKRFVFTLTAATSLLLVLLPIGYGGEGSTRSVEDEVTASVQTGPLPPGVSSLSYSPKPFYKGMHEMRVRFTTTGPAGQGRRYRVLLFTGLDDRDEDCIEDFQVTEFDLGSAFGNQARFRYRRHHVWVTRIFSDRDVDAPACFGKAKLFVLISPFRENQPRRVMRTLTFEILPPRSR